jgi:signal transduction histidine kinase
MLQSIGKLSAGIAHEINTPIQFLGDNMRFLDDSFKQMSELTRIYAKLRDSVSQDAPDNEIVAEISSKEEEIEIDFLIDEIPQAIQQSLDGIKLVSKIVSAMRDFSHIDDRKMAAADLNKALGSTITILRNDLKYVADVEKQLDENLPEIVCCVDDMHQVFLNLLINAAHSIEEVIDAGSVQRGLITVKTFVQDQHVVIAIADTGGGIPPEIREKIFEPFFTTKKKNGKGTGQGLAMVLSIVHDKHNGRIELESEVGVGTTFTIKLPIDSDNKREE